MYRKNIRQYWISKKVNFFEPKLLDLHDVFLRKPIIPACLDKENLKPPPKAPTKYKVGEVKPILTRTRFFADKVEIIMDQMTLYDGQNVATDEFLQRFNTFYPEYDICIDDLKKHLPETGNMMMTYSGFNKTN